MIRYYVDEDLFLLEVTHSRVANPDPSNERNPANPGSPGDPGDPSDQPATAGYDVTLIELPSASAHIAHSPLNSAHGHAHVHESGNTWTCSSKARGRRRRWWWWRWGWRKMDVITRGFRRFCVNKSEREREREGGTKATVDGRRETSLTRCNESNKNYWTLFRYRRKLFRDLLFEEIASSGRRRGKKR